MIMVVMDSLRIELLFKQETQSIIHCCLSGGSHRISFDSAEVHCIQRQNAADMVIIQLEMIVNITIP